jgi:hypothetical protein
MALAPLSRSARDPLQQDVTYVLVAVFRFLYYKQANEKRTGEKFHHLLQAGQKAERPRLRHSVEGE